MEFEFYEIKKPKPQQPTQTNQPPSPQRRRQAELQPTRQQARRNIAQNLTREQAARRARVMAAKRKKATQKRKARRRIGAVAALLVVAISFFVWQGFTAGEGSEPSSYVELPQSDVVIEDTQASTEPAEFNKDILEIGDTPPYVISTTAPYTIAVDPGHGGIDSGAEGYITEVEMIEPTVEALMVWLEQDPNFNPVLTRELGDGSSVGDRSDVANAAEAALFISIHGNSDVDEDSYGFECFPQPPGRLYHEDAVRFATLITQGMESIGARIRGETGVRYAYYVSDGADGFNKKITEESDTEVREDLTFGVIEKTYCPAVLVEQCFVTNQNDVYNFGDADGCIACARVYYEAICAYFGTTPIEA